MSEEDNKKTNELEEKQLEEFKAIEKKLIDDIKSENPNITDEDADCFQDTTKLRGIDIGIVKYSPELSGHFFRNRILICTIG